MLAHLKMRIWRKRPVEGGGEEGDKEEEGRPSCCTWVPGLSLRKMYFPFLTFPLQVCFEEMVPPTKIFQCGNGHHICETCKWVNLVQIGNIHCVSPKIQNSNQVKSESPALPKVQKGYYGKGNRHGKLPQGCFGTKIVDPSLSTVSLQYFCFLRMPDSTRTRTGNCDHCKFDVSQNKPRYTQQAPKYQSF